LGIGELSSALAHRLGKIEYKTEPKAVDYRKKRMLINGDWVPYRAIVSSIPLNRLFGLLVDPPGRLTKAAGLLRCTSLRYLDVALARPAGTPYHWTYVPEKKYPFYRVGCYSNFSSAMAPEGRANLYVELASRGALRLDTLMPKLQTGLMEMGLISDPTDIAFVRPRRISHAYVIYDRSHTSAVPRLLSWLESHQIFSAGRYARWEYSAMEDALAQGVAAAGKVKDLD
jgi:protoporphyrinogen oxidase